MRKCASLTFTLSKTVKWLQQKAHAQKLAVTNVLCTGLAK